MRDEPTTGATTRRVVGGEIVNGTTLSLADVVAWLCADDGCARLFRRYPQLDPDQLREAVERAAKYGLTERPSDPAGGSNSAAATSD
ncbi:MAG TPA: hypothetical protein VKA32_03235 [Gammaproteobacteria bacterium]|nr:hypothetical protein [Gammaproteobacteria bacterium]